MLISTKGRYALRVMIDLAESREGGHVAMKTVAARQGISLKYLERILPVLTKNGLIEGIHGKGADIVSAANRRNIKLGRSFVLQKEILLRYHVWNVMRLSVREGRSVVRSECGQNFIR